MMGGRVIEENIDFYRYLICRLPPASVLMIKKIANRLQSAIKQNIMKKKRRRYLWQEQQMYLHVSNLK